MGVSQDNAPKSLAEIERTIKRILVTALGVDADVVTKSDATMPLLGNGIGLDSMETLTLVAGVEEAFDIQVEDDDLTVGLFNSIGSLTEYVFRKRSDRSNGVPNHCG
jgi:acyl carrier protein